MHYAIHQLNFRISEWLNLSTKEKAFYFASMQIRTEQEQKENKNIQAQIRK